MASYHYNSPRRTFRSDHHSAMELHEDVDRETPRLGRLECHRAWALKVESPGNMMVPGDLHVGPLGLEPRTLGL